MKRMKQMERMKQMGKRTVRNLLNLLHLRNLLNLLHLLLIRRSQEDGSQHPSPENYQRFGGAGTNKLQSKEIWIRNHSGSGWGSSGGLFDLEAKRRQLAQLKELSSSPDLWQDPDRARDVTRRAARLEEPLERWEKLSCDVQDVLELETLIEDEASPEWRDLQREKARLNDRIAEWEFQRMMSGPDDHRNAILTIHPGAGGTESADWAAMLLRMYLRYIERHGYKGEVIDLQPGDQAGIKSASVEVIGSYVYGRLRAESGVHRLVRLSPFDANNRRHTSFASVFLYPEIEEAAEVDINPADLRIDTFRASGAGGQHVNKTDSAVRITHIPTNTVVTCQSERSQHRNRDTAMRFLMAKLLRLKRDEEDKKREALEAEKTDIGWGSQIRSYVLHPYKMIKDLRTNVETSNVDAVLDGDLDPFIEAFLLSKHQG